MNTLSRGSFLKTAGVATGAAAITASPAVAAALQPGALETTPSGPLPHEPIVAIIRNADLGEVRPLDGFGLKGRARAKGEATTRSNAWVALGPR